MAHRREDPSLAKIILAIILLGCAGFGLVYFARWFSRDYLGNSVEAEAPGRIEQARQLVAEGKTEQVREVLQPVVTRLESPTLVPQALMLLADAEKADGATDKALELLKRASSEFPTSPERPKAMTIYARLLEQEGQTEEALKLYEELRSTAPPGLRAAALSGLGRAAAKQGNAPEARKLFAQAVKDAPWNSAEFDEALDALGPLNVELIFSRKPTEESKIYTVEAGDNLIGIGMKLNTTQGLLMRANGLDESSTLHVGQRLKYTPKDFRIIIERSTCRLFLMDDNGIFKRYRLGLGKKGYETTLGNYKIGNKMKDPPWDKPGEGRIPPGDPRNELGTRWMPLVPVEDGLPTDLGIHGTIHPETVGGFTSLGCARLLPADVEELYDLVVRSTPVRIVEVVHPESLR